MKESSTIKLILVVPCYNEEDNVPLFVQEEERELAAYDWQALFVNDGSADSSWEVIRQQAEKNPRVHGLCFARNFGPQSALKAGLEEAYKRYPADVYVTLDADLQHPISLIPCMLEQWEKGPLSFNRCATMSTGTFLSLRNSLPEPFTPCFPG